ncbi:MAG TPA: amylo-alpha-1,6-glucosidase [Methylomirabilota bacterium]|jgi:glycogen debranching enzyme|nr:amylo-alpha-1,6-glucosidase [Methylomirabilota bacterium]
MTERLPSDDVLIGEHYYILASSVAADLPKLVLKHDDAFLVADRRGDFPNVPGEFGFYVGDTRFLSILELRLHGLRAIALNAGVSNDALEAAIDLTNPDVALRPQVVLPGRSMRLARRLTIYGTQLYHWVSIESFVHERHDLDLTLVFAADFVDVFEVRGHPRPRRGEVLPRKAETATVRLGYRGLDGVVRTSTLVFDPPPTQIDGTSATYRLPLAPGDRIELALVVTANVEPEPAPRTLTFAEAARRRRAPVGRLDQEATRIRTNHDLFDHWLARARQDLHLLFTETPDGFVPYAGIPWYVAPFGRDALITALQLLPFEPDIARGTLRYLARYQGTLDDAFTDQEPGKILHEYRRGEMARCREIPFIPYFGSVDATPLFVMLAAEYLTWSADVDFARELWPAVERALEWMRRNAEAGRGFLTYMRRSPLGLPNQGWKDSHDSVMHADGRLAEPPIALAEAQGYWFAALLGAAEMAEALGRDADAPPLRARARRLQERFEAEFWLPDEAFYALALDGHGAPCRVISSNPGHLLWTRMISDSRAHIVARRLTDDDMFTGWGLRTLATRERQYNPMSYHNGSVWPHDTAIAAVGMRAYGLTAPFLALATGLFESILEFENLRMPELFCGFPRVAGYAPTRYPVACSPQAWAAGVVFQLIGAMLGLRPDAADNQITLVRPTLPGWLTWLEVRGLRVSKSRLGMRVSQGHDGASVELLAREGDVELVVRR